MKTRIQLMKLLAGMTVLGIAASAYSLTIVPTFDSSITGDPNGAAMEAAINAAIQVYESTYTNNVTVNITFVSDPSVGLGQSSTYYTSSSYSSFHTALKNKAADANDTNALSKLPNGSHDPVVNGTIVNMTLPLYRCLGLGNASGPGGLDSTISVNTTIVNFTRPGIDPDNYDMEETVEHEIDEVLGTASALPDTADGINAMDLFRYDTNLNRSFTTSGDNAYFSVDGTNLWARYNQDGFGDYGDFWSFSDYWAPPGKTAGPQVQDAYATSGQYEDIGINEMAMLDVIGWTLIPPALPLNPVITITHNGAGHVKLSWSTNYSQFSLQESTNLSSSGAWVASASGATNPAIILSAGVKKFYRLYYQPPVSSVVTEQAASMPPSTNVTVRLQTHVYHPYKY